jgi:hypothetical protein
MRYGAAEAKPDQVIYMDAGKCVNSFVYRVLINRTTESRTENRKSRIAEAFGSTARSGCATKTCSESSFSARAKDFD